ncbi:MAG: tetratricopeptide repeat protein [Micrococcales bacterium]
MTKFTVLFTLMLLALYAITLGAQTVALFQSSSPIGIAMGTFLIFIPLLGIWGIAVEVRFGIRAEKLAKKIQDEGKWPNLDFETTPSGRPVKANALKVFDRIKEESQGHEDDYHSWFNLALAYDACGDRKRARACMRKAIKLQA